MQLSSKQTDPANVFVENQNQIWETQWAMENVESASKKFKNFQLFFDKNWPKKKMTKSIRARRSTEWCYIDLYKNISFSKLTLKTGLKKILFAF